MHLSYERAREQLHAWTTNPSLLNHARVVETVMRQAALRVAGGGPALRAVTGLGRAALRRSGTLDRLPIEWLRTLPR